MICARWTLTLTAAGLAACQAQAHQSAPIEWPAYGGDAGGARYSRAAQITRTNVARLEVAWTYRTGDWIPGRTRFEATPLFVDDALYVVTPLGRVVALDPATGAERWAYDARVDVSRSYGDWATRGVSTWLDPTRATGAACRRRVFVATIDARLVALDAATGRPCGDFGRDGEVNLETDLVNPPFEPGEYQVTSPPAILGDLVITGSSIGDNNRNDTPSGVVRAYDARTGVRRWAWDPIPRHSGDPAYGTWRGPTAHRTGAANAWTVLSVDAERDLVFVPTGSASPDFYGGERLGENRYANSLVALRGSTGEVVWHFQAVHHDIWDYDLAAQPALVTLRHDGRDVPAVVQVSKMGHVFVLDRVTGQPLFPVEERPVPRSDVPGESAWATQPFPTTPAVVPQTLTAADAWGTSQAEREACRTAIAALRSEGIFTPPSLRGSILFPGNIGGSHWGGVAIDPVRRIAVTPTNRLASVVRLVPRAQFDSVRRASPGWQVTAQRGTAFGMMRRFLRSPRGIPCNPPPWGALVAVDLATGAVKWEVPLGVLPPLADSAAAARWGSPNLGGVLATAGGLAFVGATPDQRLRAFDVESGRELWSALLPAAPNALPMTYQLADGRQFVVIAAGGRESGWKQGDHVVAFALPRAGVARRPEQVHTPVGAWTGQLLVEELRWDVRIDLDYKDGVPTGTFTAGGGGTLTGTLTGTTFGNHITYRVPFTLRNAGGTCSGALQGVAELANAGTLWVGEVRISGECSGDEPEVGAIALRRR